MEVSVVQPFDVTQFSAVKVPCSPLQPWKNEGEPERAVDAGEVQCPDSYGRVIGSLMCLCGLLPTYLMMGYVIYFHYELRLASFDYFQTLLDPI